MDMTLSPPCAPIFSDIVQHTFDSFFCRLLVMNEETQSTITWPSMHSPERKKQEHQTKIRTALQILTHPRKIGNWLLDKVRTVPVDGKVMQVNVVCKAGMPKENLSNICSSWY